MKMGEMIRTLRRKAGKTQEALAEALGMSTQAVSRWESGGGYPDVELIPRIANYFHVSIDELFGYDGDRQDKLRAVLERADSLIVKDAVTEECITELRETLLEFPEDPTTQNISTQYMLGGNLLVAPVFDQQKHRIYLPEGSWVDFETGERLTGGKWIVYPKNIEVIPMFLRENTMVPMLKTAPKHIEDNNFDHLELVLNIVDGFEQPYFDDSLEGAFRASLRNGVLDITLQEIPAEAFRIYAPDEIIAVLVNGETKAFRKEGSCYLI